MNRFEFFFGLALLFAVVIFILKSKRFDAFLAWLLSDSKKNKGNPPTEDSSNTSDKNNL